MRRQASDDFDPQRTLSQTIKHLSTNASVFRKRAEVTRFAEIVTSLAFITCLAVCRSKKFDLVFCLNIVHVAAWARSIEASKQTKKYLAQ